MSAKRERQKANKSAVVYPIPDARLWDLVRYARGHLHDEGLISDEEYKALVQDGPPGSPARLSGYDQLASDQEAEIKSLLEEQGSVIAELLESHEAEMAKVRAELAAVQSMLASEKAVLAETMIKLDNWRLKFSDCRAQAIKDAVEEIAILVQKRNFSGSRFEILPNDIRKWGEEIR